MATKKQATGGQATPGPGQKAGVGKIRSDKVSMPSGGGGFKTSPNSANRGKGLK